VKTTTTKSRKPPSPTTVDLDRRPNLAAEHEARGRCNRQALVGEAVEVIETGDIDWIKWSRWGVGTRLHVTLRDLGEFDARDVRLVNPWPVDDGSGKRAEYRNEVVKEFLRGHPAGRQILAEMILERQEAEQRRKSPATIPMTHDGAVAAKST
jgi:hypothetical protein